MSKDVDLRAVADEMYKESFAIIRKYLDACIEYNTGHLTREERQRIVSLQMNLLYDRSALMKQMRKH